MPGQPFAKRARKAGFLTPVGCHTWRATGVTVYLENGGRLEHAQHMAAHESPRTTKLYDRTKDEITIGEVSSGFNFNCWLVKFHLELQRINTFKPLISF